MAIEINGFTYQDILDMMKERYRKLAGYDADDASDIGIRLKLLAEQVSALYGEAAELRDQVFPQSASGKYLEYHAETRGLARKPALASEGILRFGRDTPAQVDIPIAAGIVCATRSSPHLRFETTDDAVLEAGTTYIDVPARAVNPGSGGNIASGAVCIMVTPAPGISSVHNPPSFSGGVNEESDDGLRERLLFSYGNISNGTNSAFYYDLAMNHEGVSSVNVLPRKRGRGTVDIVVAAVSEGVGGKVVGELGEILSKMKEINVDVKVSAAAILTKDITLDILPLDGYRMDDVAERCVSAVESYMSGLAVGEPLLLARLGERILKTDGIYNYAVKNLASDLTPTDNEVIRLGDITISRMITG